MGHLVMLEAARALPRLDHFLYASSSSVYGGNKDLPYREDDRVDQSCFALRRDQARG